MFTPESLASGSPSLKKEDIHGSHDFLVISDTQKCCLRQLLNDSDLSPTRERISIGGLFKHARQFMANEELRPKAMRLLLGIIHGNRAKSELYELLTEESTQLGALLTMLARGDERVVFWATLAILALETGQRPFPCPPILVKVCAGQGGQGELLNFLIRLLMSSDGRVGKDPLLTDCLISLLCEYPETGPQARAILAVSLETVDAQVDHLWGRAIDECNLPSLFLLFRLLQESKVSRARLATSATGPWKVNSLVARLKVAFLSERGKFPYVYMYLCILHVMLATEDENLDWPLIEALSKSEMSGGRDGSWWTRLLTTQVAPLLNGIMLDLLHLWRENTIRRYDKYVDVMLTAILSILFMGVKQVPEEILDTLEKVLTDPPKGNSIQTWLSFMKRDEALLARLAAQHPKLGDVETPSYEHVRFRLESDPTSVAFFVPLLQAELHQHYSNIIKSLGV